MWLRRVLVFYISPINFLFCIGYDVKKVDKCIGDIEADDDNPILKAEQEAQVSYIILIAIVLI